MTQRERVYGDGFRHGEARGLVLGVMAGFLLGMMFLVLLVRPEPQVHRLGYLAETTEADPVRSR